MIDRRELMVLAGGAAVAAALPSAVLALESSAKPEPTTNQKLIELLERMRDELLIMERRGFASDAYADARATFEGYIPQSIDLMTQQCRADPCHSWYAGAS